MVLRRARRILENEDDSREVLQEIFVSLVTDPETLPQQGSVVAWLYGVTTHRCLNRLRDGRTRARILRERGQTEAVARPHGLDDALSVRAFLGELDDELAKAAVLHFIDEMTHDEIALVLDCSRRQVGYLLEQVRALAQQRQI